MAGQMQGDELAELLTEVFGKHWQSRFSELCNLNVTTVNRWARGRQGVPKWVEVMAWALVQLKHHGETIPSHFMEASQKPQEGQNGL